MFRILCLFFCLQSITLFSFDLNQQLANLKSKNSQEVIQALKAISAHYYRIEQYKEADSAAMQLVDLSVKLNDKSLMINAYQLYSKYCLANHLDDAELLLKESQQLCEKINKEELIFQNKIAFANLKIKQGRIDEGIKDLISTKPYTDENKTHNYIYHYTLGDLFNETLDIRATYENYNTALELAVELDQDSLIHQSYIRLIEFSLRNRLYNKTREYIDKTVELIEKSNHFLAYDKLYLNILEQELFANTQPKNLLKNGLILIKEAEEKQFQNLVEQVYSNLRISFMKNDDIKSLCQLYCEPSSENHFTSMKKTKPDLYYRIKAFIAEDKKNMDSAQIYWRLSEELVIQRSDFTYISNFYIRYGQFHVRQKNKMEAVNAFKKSYEFALKSNFMPMAIESSSRLDSAYYAIGDIPNAYIALRNNKIFIDSNTKILQQEKLTILEQNSSKRVEQITERLKKEAEERSNRLQLFLIGLFIIGLISLLIFLSKKSISTATLKMFGYITFVFLFEFFIFLLHNVFHSITHSPVWLMMMNVTLIAILLPIHHATEHRVLHYLMKKNRVGHRHESAFPTIKGLIQKYKNWLHVKEEDEHELTKDSDSLV